MPRVERVFMRMRSASHGIRRQIKNAQGKCCPRQLTRKKGATTGRRRACALRRWLGGRGAERTPSPPMMRRPLLPAHMARQYPRCRGARSRGRWPAAPPPAKARSPAPKGHASARQAPARQYRIEFWPVLVFSFAMLEVSDSLILAAGLCIASRLMGRNLGQLFWTRDCKWPTVLINKHICRLVLGAVF